MVKEPLGDFFFNWTNGEKKHERFLDDLNKYHYTTRFTDEFDKESIPSLDLVAEIPNNKLATNPFIKARNRHQHLHYSSSQPDHVEKSIVHS